RLAAEKFDPHVRSARQSAGEEPVQRDRILAEARRAAAACLRLTARDRTGPGLSIAEPGTDSEAPDFAARSIRATVRCKGLRERDERGLRGALGDCRVGTHEGHGAGRTQIFETLLALSARRRIVERGHRHIERGRDAGEPPGRDAIGALLVFLQLLERDADLPREIALRQAAVEAERAQLLPDCHVFRRGAALAVAVLARSELAGVGPASGHGSSRTSNVIALPRRSRRNVQAILAIHIYG